MVLKNDGLQYKKAALKQLCRDEKTSRRWRDKLTTDPHVPNVVPRHRRGYILIKDCC